MSRADKEFSNLVKKLKEAEEALVRALEENKQTQDRIEAILKSVPEALIVTDLNQRVVLMNRTAEELFGIHLHQTLKWASDLVFDRTSLANSEKKSLKKEEGLHEFVFELPDSDPNIKRYFRCNTREIKDSSGKVTGAVTILHDITKEYKLEKMKTEFLSATAHQLRTPLTSIQGFSEILLTRDNISKEEQNKFLSYINTQALNLAKLIKDLTDL